MINPQLMTIILILPLLLNLVLLASLMAYAVRQRSPKVARHFAGVCLCLVVWNAGFVVEILVPSLGGKLLFSNISLTAINLLSPAWFALVAMHSGLYARLKQFLWLTLALPCTTILIIWTNDLNRLFRTVSTLSNYGGYLYLDSLYGPWYYWIYLPTTYFLLGLSLLALIFSFFRQQAIYRNQTGAMIISLIIPYGVSMATTYGLIPLPYYDLTPSMLTLSCIVIAYSFFRFQFLRVVPLARDIIFEQMADGVFVLDKHHKLVDLNPAALEIINLRIGETAHNILAQIKPGQMPESDSQAQITIGQGEDQRQYHARITAVRDEDSNLLGWAMLLRDNTENLRLMEQLQYMATIDAVTDVCNRRYLMQILNDEWARARRYDSMMALVMMDLDNFKLVNDTHGHLAGDAVLKEVAQICKRNLRDVDRIGRFGGEEFTMLLPETDLHGARITAERLRRLIAEKIVFYHGVEIRVTASFGVAELPPDKEATSITRFLKAADDALYVAKRAGRNRVAALDDIEPPGTGIQG
ncbi:MAG: diguanylate cyclase [Chloroflexi bacterium]|nr:MAG: diguanylate cyclase [Chloroflexota bacterium]